jgi:hypothetical protein
MIVLQAAVVPIPINAGKTERLTDAVSVVVEQLVLYFEGLCYNMMEEGSPNQVRRQQRDCNYQISWGRSFQE